MLGPCNWRLLTFITGLLCLIRADESPHSDYALAFTSPQLGVRVEQADVPTNRAGKNLLPPYQPFTLVDNIRYVDSSSSSISNSQVPHAFGSFRFVDSNNGVSGDGPAATSSSSNNNRSEVRRSDDEDIRLEMAQPPQQPYVSAAQDHYIPLPSNHAAVATAVVEANPTASAVAPVAAGLSDNNPSLLLPQQINDDFSQSSNTSQVEIVESIDLSDDDTRSARRVGFRFPEPPVSFVPQSYSEDGTSFDGSTIRRPFFDGHHGLSVPNTDPQEGNEHTKLMELFGRSARDLSLSESTNQPSRPVYLDQATAEAQLAVQRGGLRTYPTIYYQNEPRPRHYFPPKIYNEFNDFGGVTKAKFPSTWKSRTPRVIFPVPDNPPTGLSSQYINDNVVFK